MRSSYNSSWASDYLYLRENKNSTSFIFLGYKIIILNLYAFCKPCLLHKWSVGRRGSQHGLICVHVD
jgi:hypothetical protein